MKSRAPGPLAPTSSQHLAGGSIHHAAVNLTEILSRAQVWVCQRVGSGYLRTLAYSDGCKHLKQDRVRLSARLASRRRRTPAGVV